MASLQGLFLKDASVNRVSSFYLTIRVDQKVLKRQRDARGKSTYFSANISFPSAQSPKTFCFNIFLKEECNLSLLTLKIFFCPNSCIGGLSR